MKRSPSPSSAHQNTVKKPRLEPWHRKPAPALDPANDALLFQQTTIEYRMERQKPVIYIYGVTEEGNSVVCRTCGFLPYAYFPASARFEERHIPRFKKLLSDRL